MTLAYIVCYFIRDIAYFVFLPFSISASLSAFIIMLLVCGIVIKIYKKGLV